MRSASSVPSERRSPGGASLTHDIRSVAVLGAGTMGAAIAAHAANAGLAVELLDLDQEAIQGGFERMLAARPAAL
ncbi:MAG TPA: 3-hydroxyacyl-CoA dehydrogenase NAD-binding domain-containing protein, partial [Actinomycetes bacterium]